MFWDFFWLLVWAFFFAAYLVVLFQVVIDIFRSDDLSGWGKAIWVIVILIAPALGALVYLIVRGAGMAARSPRQQRPVPEEDEVRIAHAPTPVGQISHAKELLDSGAITADEYAALKAKALG